MLKTKYMSLTMVVFCAFLVVTITFAAHPEIPRISIEELKKLIDAHEDLIIIDAQPQEVYQQGHIPGAISLPWREEVAFTDVAMFPKNKLIVIYCDCGPGEADSADLAYQLQGMGFTNVKVLADPAIRGWKKAKYPLE